MSRVSASNPRPVATIAEGRPLPEGKLSAVGSVQPSVDAWSASLALLSEQLAKTAVLRDQSGGSPLPERQLLRESGLLNLAIPRQFGGQAASWPQILGLVRKLAEVDSSLAHLFAFQHLQVISVLLFGTPQQHARLLRESAERNWFWGNATNGRDTRISLRETASGLRLHGVKTFCSGAPDSDALLVSAPRHDNPVDRVFIALPSDRRGITINADWDNLGQRQTDSVSVEFDQVEVSPEEILGDPLERAAFLGTARSTMRANFSQSILTELYIGNARGALDQARRYVLEQGRAWPASGAERAAEDPFTQQRFGSLWVKLRGAEALADHAAQAVQTAWERGAELSFEQRGEVAVEVATGRAVAAQAALEITSQIFETIGASGTARRHGFDRFWRNVRVHTLHDPIDYKLRDLGRWFLDGEPPTPSLYS